GPSSLPRSCRNRSTAIATRTPFAKDRHPRPRWRAIPSAGVAHHRVLARRWWLAAEHESLIRGGLATTGEPVVGIALPTTVGAEWEPIRFVARSAPNDDTDHSL